MLQSVSNNFEQPAEAHLWMPPRRMWQYHVARAIGGLLVAGIFIGWMLIQWSSPAMRLAAGGLVLMTLWITVRSILTDIERGRGRQVSLDGGTLSVTTPQGQVHVPLAQVAEGRWHDEPAEHVGLSLIGRQGQTLAHLDEWLLADQAEARAFLQWARSFEKLDFPVHWPAAVTR